MRPGPVIALACAAALAGAGSASASDAELVRAAGAPFQIAESRAGAAQSRDPRAVQASYDAARDLQEGLRAAAPVTPQCRPLLRALLRYAGSRVREAEGVDRLSPSIARAGARAAVAARGAVARSRAACRGTGRFPAPPVLAMSPASGEAFYGPVVARAPAGATSARLIVDGREVATGRVRGGRARFTLDAPPGRHTVTVRFLAGSRVRGSATARGAYLLPAAARRVVPGRRLDAGRSAALGRALAGPRHSGAWVQDLSTGSVARANADAAFPAASVVKLGLLAGALGRLGPAPEGGRYAHDLRAMMTWSSNLAANRVFRRLGGTALAADGFRRLGATRSTYTGEYIVGTQLQPALPGGGAGAAPPRVSGRVTTARDVAKMLFSIAAAASGDRAARRATGLSAHQARMALGWLLASEQRSDNRSLLSGGVPRGTLIAQKNGWIRAARHGAGLIFDPSGTRIAVMLTYDAGGISLARGRAVGARVASVAVSGR